MARTFTYGIEDRIYSLSTSGIPGVAELADLPISTSPGGTWQYKISIPDEEGRVELYIAQNDAELTFYYVGRFSKVLWQVDEQRFFIQENGFLHGIEISNANNIESIEDVYYADWVILD